jgi:signal transduction histidine kinase/ligand-binding sensor domain-containing protein
MLVFEARRQSRSRIESLLWWFLACCLFLAGWSRAGELRPARQSFDVWRAEEETGQQNPITAIVQTSDGYLWLGTYHGLIRFDGVRSTVFDSGNTPGLQNGSITSLYQTSDGILWVGHETGQLTRFNGVTFQPVQLATNWSGGTVEAITSDQDRDVWLLNDSGTLFRVRDGKTVTVPGGASPSRKAALARDNSGKPWIVCGGQVVTLEHGDLVTCNLQNTDPNAYYERVLPSRDAGLWVLGNQRLRKWRQGRWVSELTGIPPAPGAINSLLETSAGDVLAGTLRDGLYVFRSGGETLHFSRTNGLSHDWVRALCQDQEGNLWVGTAAGLDALHPRKVQMLAGPDGFQGCGALSFAIAADDSIWAGTEGAGLYHFRNGQWDRYAESNGLSNLFVWSVLETREQELFVGTWGGGLVVKRGDVFESPGDLSRITAPVVSLYQGRGGDLWAGTTAGLYRFEKTKLVWSAGKDRLAFPDVRAISEGADGTIWFGMSGGGLGSLRGDTLLQFRKQDGLGSDFVISLYYDSDGTLWIGTSDNGLTLLKKGKFSTITSKNGLPSTVICHIVDDGHGNLWLATHAGILRASKNDLQRCAAGATQTVHWLEYGKAEGLASQTCSGGFAPGARQAPNGRLYFPTAKGLAVIDPANVTTNNFLPPVVIEEMFADGRQVSLPGRLAQQNRHGPEILMIPPGPQRFELRYTGLSFTSPDKVRFRYRLRGLESGWTDAGTKRVADYSYLRPGGYQFQVMACNNDGLWNERGATLAFTILPFFWQTWWFQASSGTSAGAALGAGIFWAGRRRVRRKLELVERQRALERERARIARDIHDDLGASLTRITMLSQSVRTELDGQPEATADVDQIYSTARELTRAMDEIVWAVNPKHDTLDSLVTYLGRFAQHFLSTAGIRCRLDVPLYLPTWALTSEVRHNVFLALKESLHNVVKHAAATEVRISMQLESNGFILVVADNGHGFNCNAPHTTAPDGPRLSSGIGLANMKKRLDEIGGVCHLDSAPGEGTRVKFVVKTHDS